jgi:hypothetical protein
LHNENTHQYNGQDRPNNDKYPNVDLFIGNAKHSCPIDQYIYTPIKDLIHHFIISFTKD